jgi:hypothetical protein
MILLAKGCLEFRQAVNRVKNHFYLQSRTRFLRILLTFGTGACAVLLAANWTSLPA